MRRRHTDVNLTDTSQSAAYHDPWLTLAEGAATVKFHPATLRRAIRRGSLRAARVGGRHCIRIKRSWLDTFVERYAEPVEVQ
jgi:excisionase family DNA binding protein